MEPEHYATDRVRLAALLRRLRLDAGFTGARAAADSGMSQPKISKWETGKLLPSAADVETVLDLYGAGDEDRSAVRELMNRLYAHVESNRTHLRRGAGLRQRQIALIEAEARELRYFSPIVVPGLLQTTEYMRRVFTLDLSGGELARAVAGRQERQRVLYQPDRLLTFVITEAALRWGFCPPEVRSAQAAHIASLATLANVEIGVIPLGAEVGELPLHGYELFDDRLVNVGLEHGTVTVTDPRDVATYHRLFRLMRDAALVGDGCRALLDGVRDGG